MMIQVLLGAVIVLAAMACANMLVTFAVIRRIAAIEASGAPDAASLALPEPGTRIGEFSTTMLTGRQYGHEDLAGRTVIAVFVSPSCSPCQEVIAALRAPLAPKDATYLVFVAGSAGDPLAAQT